MVDSVINIAIVEYPHSSKSAVYGLSEIFQLANNLCVAESLPQRFHVEVLKLSDGMNRQKWAQVYTTILLPPSLETTFCLRPDIRLQQWLIKQHTQGAMLCSACAGAFLIASTGLLNLREATTHWILADAFMQKYPEVLLNIDKILINDGDIITAGGLMSWVDLGLELVAQFTQPSVMRQLGKQLVVDTGLREQRYYQIFSPRRGHGDQTILNMQLFLQAHYHEPIAISALAERSLLTQRTFLRRFVKATGLKPNDYLQRLRVQKASDLLENTTDSFETIALNVGYADISACRRAFIKITGLTPRAFRVHFVRGKESVDEDK